MVLDMDLSGWRLEGGVAYAFEDGTIMSAGGYLVVAANPALLASEVGFPSALGPYDGDLANEGERIELRNNGGRLIDTVGYADREPWSELPAGSGLTLAKLDIDSASDHAESWIASAEQGGTPGQLNFPDPLEPPTTMDLLDIGATWSFDVSAAYPADDWSLPDYDDSDWECGEAVFFSEAGLADVMATARFTADDYYALYLGGADGEDLRFVGPHSHTGWTVVDEIDIEVTSRDHVYVAAWEVPGADRGPQMAIGEVELPEGALGTSGSTFEWVLGPTGASPGGSPTIPALTEETIALLIGDTNDADGWAAPAAETPRTSAPWGGTISEFFGDDASYVWVDTFAAASVTNAQSTYALFRSRTPLLSLGRETELTSIPTTITFRTTFTFDGDPTLAELSLDSLVADGAIYYLNGTEVFRQNMPEGAVDIDTLATATVVDPTYIHAELPSEALVRGLNVLAVEVHQAEADDQDMTFGCFLSARVRPHHRERTPTLVFNEVAPAAESPFWVELLNVGASSRNTTDLVVDASTGDEFVLPSLVLEPGELLVLEDLGFPAASADRLFLTSTDGSEVLDGVRVHEELRGRLGDEGGPWRYPRVATPGEENVIDAIEDVIINEIQYHHPPLSRGGEPLEPRRLEWIELYNRGALPLDIGGWQLVDAVAYEFPPGTTILPDSYLVVSGDLDAFSELFPDVTAIGDYTGRLDNKSDRIVLLDGCSNPADEVHYHDGGRWPCAADGGGSSLELRSPWTNNAVAESWTASDEGRRSEWATYSYRGLAEPSAVGPDGIWEELVLGLLDAGEVLLDDLSVVENPETAPVEILQNGTFDSGADAWRLLGTHRHSEVIPDPDDPANLVLRLVATGATEHMHNHAETTLIHPIGLQEYEISFRARWISGSNQVNTRLYFNRLPRTTLVDQPEVSGTPGERNSTYQDNVGPAFTDMHHEAAVPAPFEPVRVAISVEDPDGVEWVALWSSVDGAPFVDQEMSELGSHRWEAWLEGQPASSVVQLYVEAADGLGARATFPAEGPDSRVLLQFDDGLAATHGLHNFRIIMTEADSDWLHQTANVMSNDLVGATVVYQEREVFYDVGIRPKGSERGRPQVSRLGYFISFNSDQLFRGSHGSVTLDRSEVRVGHGQREVFINLMMTGAGSVSGEYNDLVHILAPRREYSGSAELQLDRLANVVLAAQFENGDEGTNYQYELIYYPLTTIDGTPESQKLPLPDRVVGTHFTELGDDQEHYRWCFLIENNERLDDYSAIMRLARTFDLSGPDFHHRMRAVIDVDQWLRSFAFANLSGTVDQYASGAQHNAQFYVRPADGRVLYLPHDLDFFGSATMPVVGNADLRRLLEDPGNHRAYYGHLLDIIESAYNGEYMARWRDQLAPLLPGQDIAGAWRFIVDRADWVLNSAPDAVMTLYPPLEFRITTNEGTEFSVSATEVLLEGEAWIDVHQINLDGEAEPLDATWVDGRRWQVTVPLEAGPNEISLLAADYHGTSVGSDTIVVTSTGE